MRTALTAVFTARGLPAPAWTDPVITPGTTAIKAAHITELRTATLALQQIARLTGPRRYTSGAMVLRLYPRLGDTP